MMHPAESIIELAFFIGWASLIAGVFRLVIIFLQRALYRTGHGVCLVG